MSSSRPANLSKPLGLPLKRDNTYESPKPPILNKRKGDTTTDLQSFPKPFVIRVSSIEMRIIRQLLIFKPALPWISLRETLHIHAYPPNPTIPITSNIS